MIQEDENFVEVLHSKETSVNKIIKMEETTAGILQVSVCNNSNCTITINLK